MHYIKAAEWVGGRRGRQTGHSSVKLYCKIRRSTVPDTLRGTQSSFADVLKFKFFSSEDLFTRESIGFPDGYWIGACGGGGVHNTIYICTLIHILLYYMNIYRNSVSRTRKGHANAALSAVSVTRGWCDRKISLGAVFEDWLKFVFHNNFMI